MRRVFVDPARVNLRKAARATLVVPFVFAVLVVVRATTPAALFAAFGSFAALVFADFGGRTPSSLRAPTSASWWSVRSLVALGTRLRRHRRTRRSSSCWSSRSRSSFSGALGGYFAAGVQCRDPRLRARGDAARRSSAEPGGTRARVGRSVSRVAGVAAVDALARPPAGPGPRRRRHRAARGGRRPRRCPPPTRDSRRARAAATPRCDRARRGRLPARRQHRA